MSTYIAITIPVSDEAESDILVARLSHIGFEGFEEGENLLHAFIPEGLYDESRLSETIGEVRKFTGDQEKLFLVKKIQPENWNAAWEKDFHPVVLDDFCAIRADFHPAISAVQHELIITPKMSFGTGHHASTFMMLQAMRTMDFYAETVLDFGTGTGVLAILAEKMGSVQIRALDNDAWSIENARENIAANQALHISLEKKDTLDGEGIFDIILANINLSVILQNMESFWQHLDENGVMVGCGVLTGDEDRIRENAAEAGFFMEILFTRDNWMSFSLKKRAISS